MSRLFALVAGVGLLCLGSATTVSAAEATREDIEAFIDYYAVRYSSMSYPYAQLVGDSWRVARCETGNFDPRVLNNARRGRYGEVGTFQFLPGPRSIFWGTPTAALGYDYWDPEANVAAAVWLISQGYGRHWSCWT